MINNLFISTLCCLCNVSNNADNAVNHAKEFDLWWSVIIPHIGGGTLAILIIVIAVKTIIFVLRVDFIKIIKKSYYTIKHKDCTNEKI